MKSAPISSIFGLSLIALLQVAAKPSTPVDGCITTKVVPSDGSIKSCLEFADKYHITFDQLLLWNVDLRKDCMNLDTGNFMCVEGPADLSPSGHKGKKHRPRPLYPALQEPQVSHVPTETEEAQTPETAQIDTSEPDPESTEPEAMPSPLKHESVNPLANLLSLL